MFLYETLVIMWFAYSQQSWPVAYDGYSAVQRLHREMRDLCFDAEHEQVYGLGRWYSDEYLHNLADKYTSGESLCQEYLLIHKEEEGNGFTIEDHPRNCFSCLRHLVEDLKSKSLDSFVNNIEKYLPREDVNGSSEI
uniref:Uncharacterized protein n=1 Tax=Photinus pyralis TaxID=7054 RepID=A0A1Y1NGI1_PHOPY